jgi:hypothetical protein
MFTEANGWGEHHFQGGDKSVSTEVKTRFATVDDAAFERPQMLFRVFNNCSNITINYNIN